MTMNDTPSSERIHISFFGKRNAGKSSLVNRFTSQEVSVVSDVKGTTTDPVVKSMELLPMGPVVITDTPGYDDSGKLGEKRVERTFQIIRKTDIAIIVIDGHEGISDEDKELIDTFIKRNIPIVTVINKNDMLNTDRNRFEDDIKTYAGNDAIIVFTNALTGEGIEELKNKVASVKTGSSAEKTIVRHFLKKDDIVILVTPIDDSAPKGRIILPQQQVLRDVLDADAVALTVKETDLETALYILDKRPRMVITDSQVFPFVAGIVPEDIILTSFSILLANYKGFLDTAVKGAASISDLKEGDMILISEGCTHHRQCEDIGTVKLPALIRRFTGKDIAFETSSGNSFPSDLDKYSLVLHCGACMLNEKEVISRMSETLKKGLPFTNYGISIAYMTGILKRSLSLFPDLQKIVGDK